MSKKTSPLPKIHVGDLISLPEAQVQTLCLVIKSDYAGNGPNGIYYMPVRYLPKYGKNVEGEVYHLSRFDLEDIKRATPDGEFRIKTAKGTERQVLRLEYELKHYTFDEATYPEVFFIRYAKTTGTHFWKKAVQAANEILLRKDGILLQVEEVVPRPTLTRKRSPAERALQKPSPGVSIKYIRDISLDDAKTHNFISPETHAVFAKLQPPEGVLTLGLAYQMAVSKEKTDKSALAGAFKQVAGAMPEVTKSSVLKDVRAGWKTFKENVEHPDQYDFPEGLQTSYPDRSLT